jgi:hypothetical protein
MSIARSHDGKLLVMRLWFGDEKKKPPMHFLARRVKESGKKCILVSQVPPEFELGGHIHRPLVLAD